MLNRVHLHTKPTQICNLLETIITTFRVCLARLLFRQFQVLATESHHKGVQHHLSLSFSQKTVDQEMTRLVSGFPRLWSVTLSSVQCFHAACWLVTGFALKTRATYTQIRLELTQVLNSNGIRS